MSEQPRVYIASKMRHAERWRELRNSRPDIYWTARWPYLEPFVPPTSTHARVFWQDDEADIMRSNWVLVYADPGDQLRGALVEAGMGIAHGCRIMLVGDPQHPCFGTWQFHPAVKFAATLEHALQIIKGAT